MLVIDCPTLNQNTAVHPPSPGPGFAGTMCVYGRITDGLEDLDGSFVRVRILNGDVGTAQLPGPGPTPGDGHIDTPVNGDSWSAQSVPAPAFSDAGSPLTAVAWLFVGSGSGQTPTPVSVWFVGGGSNPSDCCSGASGSGGQGAVLADQLASAVELEITIPSGTHAGAYRATTVSFLTWEVMIGGAPYRIVYAEGETLTLHGPSASVRSSAVDFEPFLAAFPGDLFDVEDEIVVIVA